MALVSTSLLQVPIYFGVVVLEKMCSGGSVQRIFKKQECRLDLPPRCFLDADSEAQGKMPPKSLNFHACWIESSSK